MGVRLLWHPVHDLLEYACSGAVDGDELVRRNLEALEDPRFPSLKGQLCDMEEVSTFDISRRQIRRIVELDFRAAGLAPACDRVAIAASADLVFGFARMYEMTLDGRLPAWEVHVVRTRRDALEWLGIPVDLGS